MSVGAVNKSTGDRIPTAGMQAIDDALDLTSVNPVQNAIITAALANKQDKTDNSLQTTDKTVVGAVNELKSGLTNYEAITNSALDLPENTGKNLIPLSVATLKAINTGGTWNDNAYTFNGVTFTVQTDANGNITGIKATGSATGGSAYMLLVSASGTNPFTTKMLGRTVILNGCPAGGGESTYKINIYYADQANVIDTGSGATKTYPTTGNNNNIALNISNGYEIATGGIMFYPMLRMADIADATFAPYIPSVESRIEAVESGLTNQGGNITPATNVTNDTVDYSIISRMGNVVTVFVSLVIDDSISAWNKLADLSTGFRPIHTTMVVGWMTTTSEPCLVRIANDGSIMISKAVSTGKVQFSASYIVN